MEHEHAAEEKEVAFQAQAEELKELVAMGAQAYFEREFPDLNSAFLADLSAVVCMDEGTAHKDLNGEGKLCFAGSGILYPAANEEERVEKVAQLFIQHGIKDITSHGSCGAAGIAYKRDFPDASPTAKEIEDYAITWAKKVVNKIKELGHEAYHTHILADDMERPAEFHNARVVYYDGVGGFNPDKIIDEPMGFVIARKYVPAEYAAGELKVAANIAFGDHGFQKRFSAATPFVIIAFADSAEAVENLKKEAASVLAENENYQAGKIKVDGVVVK